jgi:hypothetical protein
MRGSRSYGRSVMGCVPCHVSWMGLGLLPWAAIPDLKGGLRGARLWDVTEFQEFFIALGLLALAIGASSQPQERYAAAPSLHGSLVKS